MNKNTVLEVKNLTMKFGGLVAVDNLSFDVKEKEVVGIIGPNGAGKTTVFNCITQFYKDDEGEIWFQSKKKISDYRKIQNDYRDDLKRLKYELKELKLQSNDLEKKALDEQVDALEIQKIERKEHYKKVKKNHDIEVKKFKKQFKNDRNKLRTEIKNYRKQNKGKKLPQVLVKKVENLRNNRVHPSLQKNKSYEVNLNYVKVTDVINHGLVRTFQNIELVKDLSILDNILIGSHNGFKRNLAQNILNTKKNRQEEREVRERVTKILKDLNIEHIKDQLVYGQPYGVLKKVEIARTLMLNPKVIILDEPAAGLNDLETKELSETINQIKNDFDCSIVLIEHDMGFVMDICDRICAINFGKFLAMDTPKNIQSNKLVQEAYLGGDDDE